ncbi:YiiX/YebB-like N1pC/P60 family cysteine hydrolase [Fictibacillus sp. NRS-1165]|uniref:YiiX/YebB-like N1pC/P60 family cysteine hydrolase n=1 Tax=Fictibacillus sp. NRS-1165 TaxID=3144463 RepID=UPI003D1A9AE3
MLKIWVGVIAVSSILLGAGTCAHAEEGSSNLTSKQKAEIQQAKLETNKLKKSMDSQKSPKFYGDKKVAESGTISAAATTWKRKGIFYVTTDTASSGSSAWAGGHAGISYNSYYAIESFGNKGSALNGVNLWDNNWNSRYIHFKALSTHNTTVAQDASTADKAYTYAGLKPYNYNFFNINQDNSFYCSQLVWYAYMKKLNIDLNDGGAVWPVDLTQTSKAYTVYSQ